MKAFIHTILISSFFFANFSVKAQDTIMLKNEASFVVKVLEVNPEAIIYNYFGHNEGLSYTILKKDIQYVAFANGFRDSMKTTVAIIQEPANPIANEKIEVDGKVLRYHGKKLNDRQLKFMIDNSEAGEKKELMKNKFNMMQAYERRQKIYTPAGLFAGFAVVPLTFGYVIANGNNPSYDNDSKLGLIAGGIIAGAIIRITSVAVHHISKNKRFHQRKNIALLYNNDVN